MAEIYKQTQCAIVWLGSGDEQSATAMRLIADTWFAEELPAENYPQTFPRTGLWFALQNKHRDYLHRLLQDRHSVESLLHRPYWNRLWVVQEFVLAKDIVLACGPCAITPTAIERLRSISFSPRQLEYPQDKFITIPEPVRNLFDARHARYFSRAFRRALSLLKFHLIALLRDFSMRKCEDPRDMVYGLLALCNENVDIVVDYSKPMDVVFREVFNTLIYFEGYDEEWFVKLAQDMGVRQKRPAPSGSWHQWTQRERLSGVWLDPRQQLLKY